MRFFRFNGLAIEEHKVRDNLYGRIIGRHRVFDYQMLHKLLTGEKKAAIVYNPAIQVSGLSEDNRRTIAHKEKINIKALSSLTAPKEAFSTSANRSNRASKIAGGP